MNPTAGPRLADGVERCDREGVVVLAAPGGRSYCQLPLEHDPLLRALDGRATGDQLAARFGPETPDILAGLHQHGFLADSTPAPAPRIALTARGLEVRGAHRPVRFLVDLLPAPVRAFLGRVLLLAAAPALAAAALQVHHAGPAVAAGGPLTAGVELLALAFAVIVAHELAHAVVLAHFGRDIGAVGVGLYWGAPCFFVDASAAVLLDRRARILQAAAGSVADAVLAGVFAALATRPPTPWLATLGGWGAGLCLSAVAVNLIPVLELDGYWILTDALAAPDLFSRATTALRNALRGRGAREERMLAAYGAAGIIVGVAGGAAAAWSWAAVAWPPVHRLWWQGPLPTLVAALLCIPMAAPALHLLTAAAGAALRTARR